jgi:hypothetical protein
MSDIHLFNFINRLLYKMYILVLSNIIGLAFCQASNKQMLLFDKRCQLMLYLSTQILKSWLGSMSYFPTKITIENLTLL